MKTAAGAQTPVPLAAIPTHLPLAQPIFEFSERSKAILRGVHPKYGKMSPVNPQLAEVVLLAIEFSPVDMTILSDTLRTVERQREFVIKGASKTMRSKHLPDRRGLVNAVDIGAIEFGKVSWRPDVYFQIAEAVQKAARALDVPIVWGGCWAKINGYRSIEELHAEYVARKFKLGLRPFFDGPHFQI